MGHTLETAASGRSKCRACGETIGKGQLRLGERLPNLFTDQGEMTLWFHVLCGAYSRPEAFLEALGEQETPVEGAAELRAAAERSVEHPRLQRFKGVELAKTGRAACRQCRETIDKGQPRVILQYFEDGRFNPAGYLHPGCVAGYVGTPQYGPVLQHFAGQDYTLLDGGAGPRD